MDTRLYISKQTYTIQTIEKNIEFTVSPYILYPNGMHTDVTIGDWHYGYVNYFNLMTLHGWCPEPTQLTDTPDKVSYWDLGLQNPTEVEVEVEIDNDPNPVGCVEFGIGNSLRQITTGGVSHFTLNPSAPDIDYGYKLVVRASGGSYIPGQHTSLYIIALKVKFVRPLYDPLYKQVDIYDDIDIPVTYNVADVRDISKKDSNWSLTIKLPNTQNNAQLFELNDDISRYDSTFEMLKQYPAYIEVGCNRTFEGYFKLTKVIINDNKEVSYEGNLYSNVIEFMKRLGTTTLRGNANLSDDLSFSDYTTTLTADEWFRRTDTMTWDTTPDPDEPTGYKPWGKDFFFAPVDKYNFDARNLTLNNDSQEGIPIFFDEFTPFLFYKEIWDRIFQWAGFSYVSDFIQNTPYNTTAFEFDHLAYPATGLIIEAAQKNHSRLTQNWIDPNYDNLSFVVDNNWQISDGLMYINQHSPIYGDQHSTGSVGVSQTYCYNGAINTSYYMFTALRGGLYNVKVNIPWKVDATLNNGYGNTVTQLTPFYAYCNDVAAVLDSEWDVSLVVERNGVQTKILEDTANQNWAITQWNVSAGGTISDFIPERLFSGERTVYLQPGDKLYIRYHFYFPEMRGAVNPLFNMSFLTAGQPDAGCGLWFTMKFLPLDSSVYGTNYIVDIQRVSDYYIGGTFDPTVILNPKRKKTDFITDIIKKFNLYIEDVTDKKDVNGHYYRDENYYPLGDNKRNGEPILRIEPRPLYYKNQVNVRDWTTRTDVGSISFNRIDDYLYSMLDFNDKNDKTYFIEDYNNYNYTEGEYGEEIITSPYCTSDSVKSEVKTELGQTMIYLPKKDYNKYLECPSIITYNNDGTIKKDKEYNDRMLFACNVYPGTDPNNVYPWDFNRVWNDSRVKSLNVYYRDNSNLDNPTFTPALYYGYARTYILLNNLNVPFGNDTADLNFGWANWYLQNMNGTWVTSNNVYNIFYKDMIDDYNSQEARLMTCKMYLKSSDIRDLQLSDTILVNSVAYHINKIKQWRSEYEPVEVELIKIIQSTSNNNQPILKKNNPPKVEIVTLNTLKELIESQNKAIGEMNKMVENLDGTVQKMDEKINDLQNQITKLDERVKKLEEGGGDDPSPSP